MSGDESPLDQTTLTACGAVFGLTAAEMVALTEDSGPHYRPTRCMHESKAGFRYCGAEAVRQLFGIAMCEDHFSEHLENLRHGDVWGIDGTIKGIASAVIFSLQSGDESDQSLGRIYLDMLSASGMDLPAVTALDILTRGES